MKPLEVWTCQRAENLKKKSSKIPKKITTQQQWYRRRADKLSAAAARRSTSRRRRPQIVGGGGSARPAHGSTLLTLSKLWEVQSISHDLCHCLPRINFRFRCN